MRSTRVSLAGGRPSSHSLWSMETDLSNVYVVWGLAPVEDLLVGHSCGTLSKQDVGEVVIWTGVDRQV